MLTYSFEANQKEPLYEQLYHFIRQDILTGQLHPGEKLPSKRSLAQHLGISTITVEGAYGQLTAEGYCYTQPKRGFFVSSLEGIGEKKAPVPVHKAVSRPAHVHYLADFAANSVNPADFPFHIWTKMLREVVADEAEALLNRSPSGGVTALREAIADHLQHFRGLAASPEQIIVGAGTEYLYSLLVKFLGRDKCFCVEEPGYSRIRQIYESNGASCALVGMDEQGIRLAELRAKGAQVVHISPSHHFPTGRIMPISRRYELLGWANEQPDRYIIEDDYDSEFRLTGRPIPTMMGIDVSGKVIYMNTFSKSLTPTIRISYMVLPSELVRPFYEQLGFYSCTVSNFEQYTLARFIREGHFEKHINRMRTHYRKRREKLLALLRKGPLAGKTKIIEHGSGLHMLLRFDTRKGDAQLQQAFRQAGIQLKPLQEYYSSLNPEAAHTFVLNYSGVEERVLSEAIVRIAQCL